MTDLAPVTLALGETRVVSGVFKPGEADWVYLPIEVPEGARSLSARYTYDRPEVPAGFQGNALDLGVFDPAGIRGWSGGARDSFTISAAEATPGYIPGPIRAGTWRLVLGPYTVAPGGLHYEVTVSVEGGEEPAAVFEPSYAPHAVPGRGAGWYRGDLHLHTLHSDGQWTPAELVAAARAAGLDFIGSSEHNTYSASLQWGHHATDDLLIIDGEEVTTRTGHLLAMGLPAGEWIDWRFRAAERGALAEQVAKIRSLGGIAVANHPFAAIVGGLWRFGYDEVDAIEVWNGAWGPHNEIAVRAWDNQLLASSRWVPAVGNSDSHEQSEAPGLAQTVVFAEDLSRSSILDGLRAGRSYLAESSSVEVTFEATTIEQTVGIGERLVVDPDQIVAVTVSVRGVPDALVRLHNDKGPLLERQLPENSSMGFATTPRASAYVRLEVRHQVPVPIPGMEPMAALTNPIFLG